MCSIRFITTISALENGRSQPFVTEGLPETVMHSINGSREPYGQYTVYSNHLGSSKRSLSTVCRQMVRENRNLLHVRFSGTVHAAYGS
jgi:hypothetical protein